MTRNNDPHPHIDDGYEFGTDHPHVTYDEHTGTLNGNVDELNQDEIRALVLRGLDNAGFNPRSLPDEREASDAMDALEAGDSITLDASGTNL